MSPLRTAVAISWRAAGMSASVCHEPGLPVLGEAGESPQLTAANPSAAQRAPLRFIRQMYLYKLLVEYISLNT